MLECVRLDRSYPEGQSHLEFFLINTFYIFLLIDCSGCG
jgi:hypothetical protein